MPPEIRVLCVDDRPELLEVLARLINVTPGMRCVGTLASADRLVDEAVRLQPDVVTLDAIMPGRDPIDALDELTRLVVRTGTILLSGRAGDADLASRAARAGAVACIAKDEDPDRIIAAIRAAAEVFPP